MNNTQRIKNMLPDHILNTYDVPGVLLWKKDMNSVYSAINPTFTHLMGFKKPENVIGIKDENIPCGLSKFADIFLSHDQHVIKTGLPLRLLEIQPCVNNVWKVFSVSKLPLYNNKGQISGTMAHANDVTDIFANMSELLSMIQSIDNKNTFYQNSYYIDNMPNQIELTDRQSECLFFLIRGKTAKEISELLKLSIRTIEHYIDHIKVKYECKSKSELIEKCISKGLLSMIPKSILQIQSSIIIN